MNRILEKLGLRKGYTDNNRISFDIPKLNVVDSVDDINIKNHIEGDYFFDRKSGEYFIISEGKLEVLNFL